MSDLNAYFDTQQEAMLALLESLVRIESPTHDKSAVDRMSDRAESEMTGIGGQVRRISGVTSGDIVVGEWAGKEPQKPILMMCHMDTVWPLGSLAARPPRVEELRPTFARASQNMATAATLLDTLPAPSTDWVDRVYLWKNCRHVSLKGVDKW